MTDDQTTDVLIVGGGIMGAAVAASLREADPALRITMVDAGSVIGDTPGLHLHDVADPALWAQYNERVSSGIQGMYTGAEVLRDLPTDDALAPGMFHSLAFGHEAEAMSASAIAWNAGGMGVHWTAATPWPAGGEVFDDGRPEEWADELETARRLLHVVPAAIGPTAPGEVVLDVLRQRYAGIGPANRSPQPMPMAVAAPDADGVMARTGPSVIFPPIARGGDAAFRYLVGTLVPALLLDETGTRVTGARLRDTRDGSERELRAERVIVCADALRTPQLLFASGIRPDALGRYLNEHAFVTSRVLMDLTRFGLDLGTLPLPAPGEFCTDSLWLPQNGPEQPFHGQIMNTTYVDDEGHPLAYSVGVSLYTPVESRPENRLVFSETEHDRAGMPRMRFHFAYSDTDSLLIERALDEVQALAEEFGAFDPQTERALLVPGSSLHLTGTVRSGVQDDGTSVCDPDGRVWGIDNLFLAGTGVIPTPVVANATLTGVITAVRAARAVLRELSPRGDDRRPPHFPSSRRQGDMHMELTTEYRIRLPEWVEEELAGMPDVIPDLEERMRLVHRLADRNWREGNGGPFAALVAETATGRIVSVGVNVVLASGVSSGHAEVVALGLAQARLGSWDLGGEGVPDHELVVNWRPCIQCYGATMWSGVRTLVVAGNGPELEEITTFDEGPLGADWAEQFEARGIAVVHDILRDEALAVFRDYREAVDADGLVVYNARGGAE